MRNEMAAAARNLWGYTLVTLRDRPELLDEAAVWFHEKWGVPEAAYRERMADYLSGGTEYGWYLCLNGGRIVGGLGVIDNDFHDRRDLAPNVCAVYTEEDCRGRGVAGGLLELAVEDMRSRASPRCTWSQTTSGFTSATAGSSSAWSGRKGRQGRRACMCTGDRNGGRKAGCLDYSVNDDNGESARN